MDDLIKALTILKEYMDNDACPTHCEHDVLMVTVDPEKVPEKVKDELEELGFFPSSEYPDVFISYRFGSA